MKPEDKIKWFSNPQRALKPEFHSQDPEERELTAASFPVTTPVCTHT